MVISKLPRAGLGNKLFVWAHGVIFAHHNRMKHVTIGWVQIMIGPILRGEKSTRLYRNYFENEENVITSFFISKKNSKQLSYKECVSKIKNTSKNYRFTEIPHWDDYFYGIRENRDLIKSTFFKSLTQFYNEKYRALEAPEIGVHIRLGDFKNLQVNQDFAKVGHTRTPQDYFINIINDIRAITGKLIPVTIFTDGNKKELNQLFELNNIKLSENNVDLLDLLQLSKSKLIILSAGSTFGQWAAFFSESVIIHHPDHFHSNVRNLQSGQFTYEGIWSKNNPLLNNLINEIFN